MGESETAGVSASQGLVVPQNRNKMETLVLSRRALLLALPFSILFCHGYYYFIICYYYYYYLLFVIIILNYSIAAFRRVTICTLIN